MYDAYFQGSKLVAATAVRWLGVFGQLLIPTVSFRDIRTVSRPI